MCDFKFPKKVKLLLQMSHLFDVPMSLDSIDVVYQNTFKGEFIVTYFTSVTFFLWDFALRNFFTHN